MSVRRRLACWLAQLWISASPVFFSFSPKLSSIKFHVEDTCQCQERDCNLLTTTHTWFGIIFGPGAFLFLHQLLFIAFFNSSIYRKITYLSNSVSVIIDDVGNFGNSSFPTHPSAFDSIRHIMIVYWRIFIHLTV